jgi:hypothetical protein
MDLPEEFEWDEGNNLKNWKNHHVATKECEEVFLNLPIILYQDIKHSVREARFIALGKTNNSRRLHIVFTIREMNVRVISARDQNKKERSRYEKEKN